MFNNVPHSILEKNTCQHKDKKCNYLNPYNNLELYGNDSLTDNEKGNNLKRYNTACSNIQGELKKCCDKNDTSLEDVLKKMKFKRPLGESVYDKFGNLESIDFCLEEDPKKCDSKYKKLSAYEICKIPESSNSLTSGKLSNFKQDCYEAKCNPQEKTMNISGVVEEDYTYEFDKEVAETIKHNKLKNLQKFILQDRTLKKRPLTHSDEGNTIYHEALKYNAGHILVYLFKNITKDIINKLNSRGNTILHMVMEQDNKSILMLALKMGCDVNAKNNNNETPIFNAIRNGLYENVRLIINYQANLYLKNKEGNTPLLLAIKTPKKDKRIVKILIDNGSNMKDEDSNKKTILGLLQEKKNKTVKEADILTYLNQKTIKNLDIPLGKELSIEQTQDLENIAYELEGEDKYQKKYDFTVTLEYEDKDTDKNFPEDLHFPYDLDENKMKPHDVGNKNYSHEPYINKFKHLQKDKIKQLQKTIQLTKWDNNTDKDKKLEIIDEIMSGKLSFDRYRKKVIVDNKITKEQEYLLDNISEDNIYDYDSPTYSPSPEEIILTTKNNKNETPVNIETTKKRNNPIKEAPAPSIEDVETDDIYDKYSYIILSVLIVVSLGILLMLYKVTQQKKLDFFN